jgi:hypothetical protein
VVLLPEGLVKGVLVNQSLSHQKRTEALNAWAWVTSALMGGFANGATSSNVSPKLRAEDLEGILNATG